MDSIIRRLKGIETRVGDLSPIWPKVRDVFWKYEKEYLRTRGFGTFEPLKDRTTKNKKRGSDPRPFFTNSHAMVDSLTGFGPFTYYQTTAKTMEIGVGSGPAHWHQVPRKFMAARPPVLMTMMLAGQIRNVIADYVVRGIK